MRSWPGIFVLLVLGGCASDYERGLDAARSRRYFDARDDFTLAIARDPEHKRDALVQRAFAEIELEDPGRADEDYRAAKELGASVDSLGPRLGLAYRVRAEARLARDELNAARADHRRALELDPEMPRSEVADLYTRHMIGMAAQAMLWNAIASCENALHFAPDNLRLLLDRAALAAATGDEADARRRVEILRERAPTDPGVLLFCAMLAEKADPKAARALLDGLVKGRAEEVPQRALLRRAQLALEDGETARALRLADRLAEPATECVSWEAEVFLLPRDAERWLAASPDFQDLPQVIAVRRRERLALLAAIDGSKGADKLSATLETTAVTPENVATLWRELRDVKPRGEPSGPSLARFERARDAFCERVVGTSLGASCIEEQRGALEAALRHTERALVAAVTSLQPALQSRIEALRVGAAEQLTFEANEWRARDPWRAYVRAKRAAELDRTDARRRFANVIATSWPTHVAKIGARREGDSLVVSVQLGDADGLVSAPGTLEVSLDGVPHTFEVQPDDYELREVRAGGETFGWERTWTSPPLPCAKGRVSVVVHFTGEHTPTLTDRIWLAD